MSSGSPQSTFQMLEAGVDCARLALACPFSSSEEYEAELIRERRAAGAYGLTLSQRCAAWVLGLCVVIAVILAVY
jgi:hypothetical protein